MLSKEHRISRKDFSFTFTSSERYHSSHLTLFAVQNSNNTASQSRISFSISKKVASTAVIRNRQRRRGYAAVAPLLSSIRPGYFLLFSFKKGSENLKTEFLRVEVRELLSKAGVLS